MVDDAAKNRDKLSYPRVLIKVEMQQDFLKTIDFENENGNNTTMSISYEWKPIMYGHCHGMGHNTANCRNKTEGKQVWIVKKPERKSKMERKNTALVDEDGFKPVLKGWKPKEIKGIKPAQTNNHFQALEDVAETSSLREGIEVSMQKQDQEVNTGEEAVPSLANG
ncbi:hypothetical protein CsatA_027798 [Cannabis sativa]